MTGSTMGEVLAMPRAELRLTRVAIGQYHREMQSDGGGSDGGSLADLAGGGGG